MTALAAARRHRRRAEELASRAISLEAEHRGELETLALEYERAITALDNMADGILMVDRDLRVERANAAALRLLRLRENGAVGHTLAEVVRDHELVGIVLTALQEGAQRTDTVRLAPLRSGAAAVESVDDTREDVRHVRATGIPFGVVEDDAGRPGRGALLVLQDVTEMRRVETMRREFIGNVSHELRTPLASIKALVETLEEGALDDPPVAREFLGQMNVEVDSLTQLVQELLELSRIESGQAAIRPEAVSAAGLLEDAARRLRRQAERAGVVIAVEPAAALPDVHADPALIERVLLNLVHNAVKFTPRGGRIALRAVPHPEGVWFAVVDTGIGMSAEDLGRIFERFYKADRSRSSRGTGLGLAIAKHIVQAHGGRIWAESEGEGRGSTFHFILPRVYSSATVS